MNAINRVVLSTILAVTAGGALAQSGFDRTEQLRWRSEMNRPDDLGPASAQRRVVSPAPVSEAERTAEEVRRNTDMMKPSTLGISKGAGMTRSAPLNDADRLVAETMQRTDRMKPN